jgi:uncharacterized protein YaiI (UPF0178 family)
VTQLTRRQAPSILIDVKPVLRDALYWQPMLANRAGIGIVAGSCCAAAFAQFSQHTHFSSERAQQMLDGSAATGRNVRMNIWVDADACPNVIKEILFRAADRRGIALTLVANQKLRVPKSPMIRSVQVNQGFDEADHWIVEQVLPGDLVITADIPLASDAVDKGAVVINPRGERYTAENIRERLVVRDLTDELRGTGVEVGGGPPPLNQSDRREFANQLDRLLTQNVSRPT